MRLVLALIQPTKLKAVQEALAKIGVERMTVCDALGYGQQRGQTAGAAAAGRRQAAAEGRPGNLRQRGFSRQDRRDDRPRRPHRRRPARSATARSSSCPIEEVVRLSDTVRGPEAVSS